MPLRFATTVTLLLALLLGPAVCCCLAKSPVDLAEQSLTTSVPSHCHESKSANHCGQSKDRCDPDKCECHERFVLASETPKASPNIWFGEVTHNLGASLPLIVFSQAEVFDSARQSDREPPPPSGRERCVVHCVFLI